MTGDIRKFSNFKADQTKVSQQQSHRTLEAVFPPKISYLSLKTRFDFGDDVDYSNNGRVEYTIIITNDLLHQQDDVAISMIFTTILIVTSEEVRHGLTLLPLPPGGEDAPMA